MFEFTLTDVSTEFAAAIDGHRKRMAKGATAAMREVTDLAKNTARASIAAGGLSARWQNALRAKVYPDRADSLNPAGFLFHRVPYADVFETGASIGGRPLLWIATDAVPMRRGRPMTPQEYSARFGDLISVNLPGRPPMLFLKYTVTSARRRRRRGADNRKALFIGVSAVELHKRFDVAGAARSAADKLQEAYDRAMES